MIKVPEKTTMYFESIKEFEIQELIGHGAYSAVHLAVHISSYKKYALKIIDLDSIPKLDHENIEKELIIHYELSHPNLVKLYDFFLEGSTMYYILEYCPNGNLYKYLFQQKSLNQREIRKMFIQTCMVVKYLHSKNIILRDLKPENILLDYYNDIKVCDLGWAAMLDDKRYCGLRAGTFVYMSPESLKSTDQDRATDLWALGVLLYEMHFNKEPYKGKNTQEQLDLIRGGKLNFDGVYISEEAKSLICSLLVYDKEKRSTLESVFKSPYVAGSALVGPQKSMPVLSLLSDLKGCIQKTTPEKPMISEISTPKIPMFNKPDIKDFKTDNFNNINNNRTTQKINPPFEDTMYKKRVERHEAQLKNKERERSRSALRIKVEELLKYAKSIDKGPGPKSPILDSNRNNITPDLQPRNNNEKLIKPNYSHLRRDTSPIGMEPDYDIQELISAHPEILNPTRSINTNSQFETSFRTMDTQKSQSPILNNRQYDYNQRYNNINKIIKSEKQNIFYPQMNLETFSQTSLRHGANNIMTPQNNQNIIQNSYSALDFAKVKPSTNHEQSYGITRSPNHSDINSPKHINRANQIETRRGEIDTSIHETPKNHIKRSVSITRITVRSTIHEPPKDFNLNNWINTNKVDLRPSIEMPNSTYNQIMPYPKTTFNNQGLDGTYQKYTRSSNNNVFLPIKRVGLSPAPSPINSRNVSPINSIRQVRGYNQVQQINNVSVSCTNINPNINMDNRRNMNDQSNLIYIGNGDKVVFNNQIQRR